MHWIVPIPLVQHCIMGGGGGADCATALTICPKKYKAAANSATFTQMSDLYSMFDSPLQLQFLP
jgi:hypothetical protein